MITASFWDGVQQGISGIEKGLAIKSQKEKRQADKEERLNNERELYQSSFRPMDSELGKQIFPDNVNNLSINSYLNNKLLDPKEVDLTNNDSIANFSNKWSKKANEYFDTLIKQADEKNNKELANSLIKERDGIVNNFQAGEISRQIANNNRLVERQRRILEEKDDIARAIQHKSNVVNFENNWTNDSHTGFSMMMNGDLKGGVKFLNDLQNKQLKIEENQSLSKAELRDYENARANGLAYGLANGLRERNKSYTNEDLRGMMKDLEMPSSMKEDIIKSTNEIITSLHLSDSQVGNNKEIERQSKTALDAITNNNIASYYNKFPNIINPLAINGKTEIDLNDRGDKLVVGNLFDRKNRVMFMNSFKAISGVPSDDMLLLRELAIMIENEDIKPENLGVGTTMQNLNPNYPDLRLGLRNIELNPDYQIKSPDGEMIFDENVFLKKNNISRKIFDASRSFINDKFLSLGNNNEVLKSLLYNAVENLGKERDDYVDGFLSGGFSLFKNDSNLANNIKNSIRKTIQDKGGVILSLNNGISDAYTVIPNIREFNFRVDSINQSFPSNFEKLDKELLLFGDSRETKKFLGAEYVKNTLEKFKGEPVIYTNLKDFLYNNALSPININNLDNIKIENGKLKYGIVNIEDYVKNHFIKIAMEKTLSKR